MREPKLAAVIARELRKFHEVEIPGSKESQMWIDLSKFFEKGLVLDWFVTESFYTYAVGSGLVLLTFLFPVYSSSQSLC